MLQPLPNPGRPVAHSILAAQVFGRPAVHQQIEIVVLERVQLQHLPGGREQGPGSGGGDSPPNRRRPAGNFTPAEKPDGNPAPRPGGARQPRQARHRQQTQRGVEKKHLPPMVIQRGIQGNDGNDRQDEAGQQQQFETLRAVPQAIPGPGQAAVQRRRAAAQRQQQRRRRRGNGYPSGDVIPRRRLKGHQFAPEQHTAGVIEIGHPRNGLNETGQRVAPQPGPGGV